MSVSMTRCGWPEPAARKSSQETIGLPVDGSEGTPSKTTRVRKLGASGEFFGEFAHALRGGHEHADRAIPQDMADLGWLQQRIDRHEDTAGQRGAEDRRDGFSAFRQVDRNAVLACKSVADEREGETTNQRRDLLVRRFDATMLESRAVGRHSALAINSS